MNYKGYVISQSLNGTDIIFIARKAGTVVFRENTETKLKQAIDSAFQPIEKAEVELAKKKENFDKESKEGRGLFQKQEDFDKKVQVIKKQLEEEEAIITSAINTGATRGPDGRFLSPKKSGFWEKLTR